MKELAKSITVEANVVAIGLRFKQIERDLETLAQEGLRLEKAGHTDPNLEYMETLNITAHSMAEKWGDVARLSHKVITLLEE